MAADEPHNLSSLEHLQNARERELNKVAAEVGRVAIAWGMLHESLGQCFSAVATPQNQRVGLDAWHAVRSDRFLREMLAAAAAAALGKEHPTFIELKWALGQITSLEDNRNDAVHAPYAIVFDVGGKVTVEPYWLTGDRRAAKLTGKNLSLELRSYESRIMALRHFVDLLTIHENSPSVFPTLPGRPTLVRPAHTDRHNRGTKKK